MKHVMGFDPGFASFGVAVVELGSSADTPVWMGVIRTQKSNKLKKILSTEDNFNRLQFIAKELERLILKYDVVALGAESMSFSRNASASAKVGMTWGTIASLSLQYKLPVFQCSPQQLKTKLTGSKQATKFEVAVALQHRYPDVNFFCLLKDLPKGEHEHAWDALASVVVCLESETVQMLRKMLSYA